MNIGLADERVYQMLLHDQTAHAAWVTANGWKYRTLPRRPWRQTVAAALVALAERIAPTVATLSTRTQTTAQ